MVSIREQYKQCREREQGSEWLEEQIESRKGVRRRKLVSAGHRDPAGGNKKDIRALCGAGDVARAQDDFYSTPEEATKALLERERFDGEVWECACGNGAISRVLEQHGYQVTSTDLVDRGYGQAQAGVDFLKDHRHVDNIITNPPYILATEFVAHALECVPEGGKVAMLLPTRYLEGVARYNDILRYNPPAVIYQFVRRINFRGDGNNALAFAWFIWVKGYRGDAVVRWIDNTSASESEAVQESLFPVAEAQEAQPCGKDVPAETQKSSRKGKKDGVVVPAGVEKLLTPEEVADLFDISIKTLYSWTHHKRNGIPFVKVGHLIRFKPSALNAWIASRSYGNSHTEITAETPSRETPTKGRTAKRRGKRGNASVDRMIERAKKEVLG